MPFLMEALTSVLYDLSAFQSNSVRPIQPLRGVIMSPTSALHGILSAMFGTDEVYVTIITGADLKAR